MNIIRSPVQPQRRDEMKNGLYAFIIASTLTIPLIFHTPESQAAEPRSPCVLSQSEKTTIAELTHLRAPLETILAGAKECIVFSDNSILIRYANGHIGVFDLGDVSVVSSIGKESSLPNIKNALSDHAGNDQERKLFTELAGIWESSASSDELPPEEIAKADVLVEEIFATTPINEIPLASYNVLGLRGNRYLGTIERSQSIAPEAAITFYEGYLGSSDVYTRTEDMPSDHDKRITIKKMVQIFEASKLDTQYRFTFSASQEIERIDPASYEKLKALGVVTEDTQ